MPYHLAIDVGTTWTAAAIGRDGRVETASLGTRRQAVPSVVCLTDERMLVGEAAARRAVSDPRRVAREFKRRVGDPTPLLLGGTPVSAELCMARVAAWVVGQVAATEGEPPESLTLTHPANWGEYKLDLYRQALHHADLRADHLVPEPVAAATAYAAQRPLAPGTTVAVYDLGGGTFDAAVIRAGDAPSQARIVGRPDGVERLGGADFDHAVFHHVATSIGLDLDALAPDDPQLAAALVQLRAACVEAKEALSEETQVSIPVMLPRLHTEVLLTRRELEAMIGPAIEQTIVALRRAVASAGVDDGDLAAVLLVGGSSRIPVVGQLVSARLGRPIAVDARPKDAICTGAAHVALAAAAAAAPATAAAPARPAPHVSSAPAVSPTASPPGSPDGAQARRLVAAGLVAVIAVAATVGGVLLFRDDGGAPAPPATTATSDDQADPTTTAAGSTSDTLARLPGDDWSDAGRAQFVQDCGTGIAAQASFTGTDADELCGCVYDDVSGELDFAAFNDWWVSSESDTTSPEAEAVATAIFACTPAVVG